MEKHEHEEVRVSEVCPAHIPLLEEIVGMRNDLKWFLRLGTGIFSICGLITTLLSPAIIQLYNRLNVIEHDLVIMKAEIKSQKEMHRQIIKQRNLDHNSISPLSEKE